MSVGGFEGLFGLIVGYSHNSQITVDAQAGSEFKLASTAFAMDFHFLGSGFASETRVVWWVTPAANLRYRQGAVGARCSAASVPAPAGRPARSG